MDNEGTTVELDPVRDDPGAPDFWGTHEHGLDAKGRVILPSRFREPFRAGAFVTKMPEGCLGVWTPDEFRKRTLVILRKAREGQAQRNLARVWAAGAFDTTPDSQGRIPIPATLRTFARLEGDVVINGAINHLEIWDAQTWQAVETAGSQHLLSGTDALDEIGF